MQDRGMIKWMPFNSVINSKYLVSEIEKEKSKIIKPTLSEEQLEIIENNILESLINQIPLVFKIYQAGFIKNTKGTVIKIDPVKKIIFLDNHKYIYFREIIGAFNISIC